jgi:outer membrane protein assembly factor BamB
MYLRTIALESLPLAILWLASPCVVAAEPERGIAGFSQLSTERDWPWWRGPSRNGIAAAQKDVPTKWSDQENVVWRTAIPGRGHSSPILVKDRIFLTTADTGKQVHFLLAIERASGDLLWQKEVSQGGFPKKNHAKNTEATSTPACDGDRIFTAFFHHETIEVFAFDMDGNRIWNTVAGPFNPKRYEYGYAPSPLVYRDTVIIAGEYDGESFLTALDRATGKPKWKIQRPASISFSSPVVANVAGRDQLFLSGMQQVWAYDPASGKQLWTTPGTATATCGTLVWDGDLVFASGGFPQAETLAVLGDGSGQVLWRNTQKCYEQSMLAHDGHLYALTGNGILFCWRGRDGQELWKQRLRGPVSSSPVLAGGHIYWANESGTTYVFRPNPAKLEIVAENKLGDESFASPAICQGRIYIRTAVGSRAERQEYLYCLGTR